MIPKTFIDFYSVYTYIYVALDFLLLPKTGLIASILEILIMNGRGKINLPPLPLLQKIYICVLENMLQLLTSRIRLALYAEPSLYKTFIGVKG